MPQKSLKKRQAGQAMIEFSLVLPLLIILTVGTIFLTVTYIHQSTMNGIAFMSARAMAVRESEQVAKEVQQQFMTKSKYDHAESWLQKIHLSTKRTGEQVQVILSKPAEQLDMLGNFINSIGAGNPVPEPRQLQAQIGVSNEYLNHTDSSRPKTSTTVKYPYSVTGGDAWDKLLPDEIKKRLPINLEQVASLPSGNTTSGKQKKDLILGTLAYGERVDEGLEERLKDFYDKTGLAGGDGKNNSEDPSGGSANFLNTSNFNTMIAVHKHFGKIQMGAGAMDFFLQALLSEIPGASDIISQVGKELAQAAEEVMNTVATEVESHTKQTFKQGTL